MITRIGPCCLTSPAFIRLNPSNPPNLSCMKPFGTRQSAKTYLKVLISDIFRPRSKESSDKILRKVQRNQTRESLYCCLEHLDHTYHFVLYSGTALDSRFRTSRMAINIHTLLACSYHILFGSVHGYRDYAFENVL